jgi:hypothetical protein
MATIINASTTSGLVETADTSGTLVLQSNGTTQQTIDSTGSYGQLKSGTAVASTSGTSIDFTSLPSWVKRITIIFDSVSLSGTDGLLIQLGYSGGFETTSYASSSTGTTGSGGGTFSSTSGFAVRLAAAAASFSGQMTITNISGNKWVSSHAGTYDASTAGVVGGGVKTISGGVLTQVRITRSGTDTFDAGSINILYEG